MNKFFVTDGLLYFVQYHNGIFRVELLLCSPAVHKIQPNL